MLVRWVRSSEGGKDDGKRVGISTEDIDESSTDPRFLGRKSSVGLVLVDRPIDKDRDGRPPYSRRFKDVRWRTGAQGIFSIKALDPQFSEDSLGLVGRPKPTVFHRWIQWTSVLMA
eukprot:scaffold726_cov371-Pavlova_lutheri.AAC.4